MISARLLLSEIHCRLLSRHIRIRLTNFCLKRRDPRVRFGKPTRSCLLRSLSLREPRIKIANPFRQHLAFLHQVIVIHENLRHLPRHAGADRDDVSFDERVVGRFEMTGRGGNKSFPRSRAKAPRRSRLEAETACGSFSAVEARPLFHPNRLQHQALHARRGRWQFTIRAHVRIDFPKAGRTHQFGYS